MELKNNGNGNGGGDHTVSSNMDTSVENRKKEENERRVLSENNEGFEQD